MLFDQFDKKLKDAADNHHPAYDEKAWVKMEKLLDKHLPVENNRRRFFFLILLALVGLGGAGVLIMEPWKKKDVVAIESPNQQVRSNEQVRPTEQVRPVEQQNVEQNAQKIVTQTPEDPAKEIVNASAPEKTSVPNIPLSGFKPGISSLTRNVTKTKKKTAAQNNKTNITFIQPENKSPEPAIDKAPSKNIFPGTTAKNEDVFSLKDETVTKQNDPLKQVAEKESAATKNKTKKQHAVFLSVTAGPDWVFMEDNGGSVKPFVGGGIGYIYNDRVSIRTGFYAGRKVYSATPGYYNPPANFYVYYPYLEKVDANCKVYEIPVSLSYHFGKPGKRSLFASAGVSSFIMKEEAYNYYYKTSPTGPTLNRSYTIKDVNKHKFAELTLSGGYTKAVTRHVSITAEPYVKLPLKGVGYGKVKLNSTGLAVSVAVNPFAKKPK